MPIDRQTDESIRHHHVCFCVDCMLPLFFKLNCHFDRYYDRNVTVTLRNHDDVIFHGGSIHFIIVIVIAAATGALLLG